MIKPLGNEDLSDKLGERVIDKPELPAAGITNENDLLTEIGPCSLQQCHTLFAGSPPVVVGG